jgi:uncharacterized protein YbjT (DUF2867 family)
LTGANGFIGSAVLAGLKRDGHWVAAVTRSSGPDACRLPADRFVRVDFSRAVRAEDWLPHLAGVDAVVNCTGVLQDSPGNSAHAVHVDGTAALFAACEQAGVRRVIHLSAIGSDREQPTAFSCTKMEGDRALTQRDLDWVILRPSVVVGRGAHGGSALLRAFAALPVFPAMPGTGRLQIVHLDDLVRTVLLFLRPGAPARLELDIAGPDQFSFAEAVAHFRRWLGYPPAPVVNVPARLVHFAARLGDVAGLLGWRPPIRSTAIREIGRGAVGDTSAWRASTGIAPQSLRDALAAEPASVQERWFGRLYLLKAVGLAVFSAFWIITGILSLGPGWEAGLALVVEGGLTSALARWVVIGGAVADILIGVGIAFRRTARLALYAAVALSVAYLLAATVITPELWADPLGALIKVAPILVLNLMLLGHPG